MRCYVQWSEKKIVDAGGENGNYGGGLTSVEIFDTTFNKWIPGNKV